MPNKIILRIILAVGLLGLALIAGCSSKTTDASQSAAAKAPSAAALAALEKADAADGTMDKTVSKCVSCMLGMDGQQKYAVQYGGYTLHFCSETCKESFNKDPEKALSALKFSSQ